jgi:hypothetical protein
MMPFLGGDDQYLIDTDHVFFLSFRGFEENGRNACGPMLSRCAGLFRSARKRLRTIG